MPVLARPPITLPTEQLAGESTFGEATAASFGETWTTGPSGAAQVFDDLSRAEGYRPFERLSRAMELSPGTEKVLFGTDSSRQLSPRMTPEQAAQSVADAGLTGQVPLSNYPAGIRKDTLDLLIDLNRKRMRRQTIASQYDGWAPQITGMVAGSIVDPGNIALSMIPVIGEARYAALLGKAGGMFGRTAVRAGVGAAEGVLGAALAEPFIYAGQQQWRDDYTAYDSMLNIAGGAIFGATLHAGAGLARDAFGRTIEAPAAAARSPFADPDVLASESFRAKAREQGVSESAIRSLTPTAPRDDVTGYFDGRQGHIKTDTVARAQRHVAQTGEPAYFVSADITNLGGLNAHVGNVAEAANVHYREMSRILDAELRATGGDVVALRTGGDELGLVLVNANSEAVAAAMSKVDDRIAQYAQDHGLADIPNPKRSTEKGVGLHTGVAPIEPGATVPDILRLADLGVDASKRGIDRVGRSASPENRPGQDPRTGARRVSADRAGAASGADARAEADPFADIRPFVAGLDQRTQADSLRMALAQAAQGQPIDVTPAMLGDPRLDAEPGAFGEAKARALRNGAAVAAADPEASRVAAQRLKESSPAETAEDAKAMLAEDERRFRDRGGDPADIDSTDDIADSAAKKIATKAVALCVARNAG